MSNKVMLVVNGVVMPRNEDLLRARNPHAESFLEHVSMFRFPRVSQDTLAQHCNHDAESIRLARAVCDEVGIVIV